MEKASFGFKPSLALCAKKKVISGTQGSSYHFLPLLAVCPEVL